MIAIADSSVVRDDGQAKAIRDAIVAGQAKAATVPLRESDGDNATVRSAPGPHVQDVSVEIPAFHGFKDFDLDLTCLSPPTSPPGSIYEDARSITPSSASPRHSISLSLRSTSPTQSRRSKVSQTKSASPLFTGASAVPRGSWPLVRYVGRGTPIDKNRRIEWGGTSNEGDDVGEDGVFFTTVRSASIDSTVHPSLRSVSPDWNILTRRTSTVPARVGSRSLHADPSAPAPSPAIQIEGLGSEKPGEWASFVHTVLGESSSSSVPASISHPPAPAGPLLPPPEEPKQHQAAPTMTPEQIQQLDAELGIDLGIDGALDLGLGYRGGMNWFNLGMLPGSMSGRETPSVYSSRAPTTPQPSRPPSVTVTPQDNRSTASIKLGGDISQSIKPKSAKSSSPMWWRRMIQGLKKVPLLMVGSR